MGLDRQLFLISLNTAGLTDFYRLVLRAWRLLTPCLEGGLESRFIVAGICTLAHLRQPSQGCGLVTPQELAELEKVLGDVQWALPGPGVG
ncbi:hypothetical protein AAFF_G00419460 [Aldrovandia affinis]|uniref:Uncharacterized protein n=1 Tax=Aldrovandia affinis TaxID=143900 RepID=A0AAD7SA17_9TELE|nr:hypothetical protein AAFF_G00419460 [Aldrovandia affinis]